MQSLSLIRAEEPSLRYVAFEPQGQRRGSVLVTPGFSEHVGRYEHVAEAWSQQGFFVVVHDLRGQGESGGQRAFVHRFDEWFFDVLALLDQLPSVPGWSDGGKPILFGHSLGALISLHVALATEERLSGVALSSPFIGQALPTPEWKKNLGRLLSGIWPTYSDSTNIKGSMLTHDPERARQIDEDPLRLPRVTARWFTEVEAAQQRLLSQIHRLKLPVFCLAAGADQIASLAKTRRLFAEMNNPAAVLEIAEGEYHELHQETRRDEHIQSFAQAFKDFAAPPGR